MRAPLWLLVAAGCAAGESEAEQAMRIADQGAELYRMRCDACHEVDGGIGPRLRPQVVAGYETPIRLFDYLKRTMPYGAPGTLTDDEYRSVVQFLIVSRALGDSSVVLRY